MVTTEQLQAWRTLNGVHSLVVARVDAALSAAGLPPRSWFDALSALRDSPRGLLRMGAVAEAVGLSPGGATRLVDRLAEAGLVERRPCPSDRRVSWIALLPEGEELAARMWPVYSDALREHFVTPLDGDVTAAVALGRVTEGVACPTEMPSDGAGAPEPVAS